MDEVIFFREHQGKRFYHHFLKLYDIKTPVSEKHYKQLLQRFYENKNYNVMHVNENNVEQIIFNQILVLK